MSELTRLPQWRPATALARHSLPEGLCAWILSSGSLTQRLHQHFGEVDVQVLHMRSARARLDEAQMLGLSAGHWVMLRVIALIAAGRPMIIARSVTPMQDYHGSWRRLRRLGRRPLGDLLFSLPEINRGELQLAQVNSNYAGIQLPDSMQSKHPLWARRCLYHRHQRPLLVAEVFLPSLHP